MRLWASDPDSQYYRESPTEAELVEIFEDIANNISVPGPTNVRIVETVANYFDIVAGTIIPTKGTITNITSKSFQWNIAEVGQTGEEDVSVTFRINYNRTTSGANLPVNESVTYDDDENNTVTFPNLTVTVTCDEDCEVNHEECPAINEIEVNGCEDSVVYQLDDYELQSLGRILQLNVRVKNVCPGKRVALAVILNEVDEQGNEYPRGLKTLVIPAHNEATCREVCVNGIKFVLPEELVEEVGGDPTTLCNDRQFNARVIAHHIDNDFECPNDVD